MMKTKQKLTPHVVVHASSSNGKINKIVNPNIPAKRMCACCGLMTENFNRDLAFCDACVEIREAIKNQKPEIEGV